MVVAAWIIAVGLLWGILHFFASFDVRDSATYTFFYLAMGLAWVSLIITLFKWLDWNYAEDVLERNNRAAASGQAGLIIGLMLAFAGANIGDGPGWFVVVFCAFLSTFTLILAWLIVDRATDWITHITVDRDLASGVRAGAFFVAGGLIVGRAVAGDWVSTSRTIHDFFRQAWGILPLLLVAGIAQALFRPSERRPHGSLPAALLTAVVYLYYAATLVYYRGPLAQ
ncbi:hypothetical protein BH09VER1_BH09VER1_50750 [soil metagenome]